VQFLFVLDILEQFNSTGQVLWSYADGPAVHGLHGPGYSKGSERFLFLLPRTNGRLFEEQRPAVHKQVGKFFSVCDTFYLKSFFGQTAQLI
jgi:hypothetical protein